MPRVCDRSHTSRLRHRVTDEVAEGADKEKEKDKNDETAQLLRQAQGIWSRGGCCKAEGDPVELLVLAGRELAFRNPGGGARRFARSTLAAATGSGGGRR
eukprot:gene35483-35468_t